MRLVGAYFAVGPASAAGSAAGDAAAVAAGQGVVIEGAVFAAGSGVGAVVGGAVTAGLSALAGQISVALINNRGDLAATLHERKPIKCFQVCRWKWKALMTVKIEMFTLHNNRGQSVLSDKLLDWHRIYPDEKGIFGPVERYSWRVNGIFYERDDRMQEVFAKTS